MTHSFHSVVLKYMSAQFIAKRSSAVLLCSLVGYTLKANNFTTLLALATLHQYTLFLKKILFLSEYARFCVK